MRNYICFLVYYVNTCRIIRRRNRRNTSLIDFLIFLFSLIRVSVDSQTLTFRRVIGMNFHVSHSVHQKRFTRQRPGPFHSFGKVCLGITRVVDTFYLPINPELAIEFSATLSLRKAFRAALAAVTFRVAIVKREKVMNERKSEKRRRRGN